MRSLYQNATINYNRTHCSSQRWSGNPRVCDVKIIFIILNHCLFHFDICTNNTKKKWSKEGGKKSNVGQNCYSFSTNQDRDLKLNSILQLHGLAFKKDHFFKKFMKVLNETIKTINLRGRTRLQQVRHLSTKFKEALTFR